MFPLIFITFEMANLDSTQTASQTTQTTQTTPAHNTSPKLDVNFIRRQQPSAYTSKDIRDTFYLWFLNQYPMIGWLGGQYNLPRANDVQANYQRESNVQISLTHIREIIRFYKMYKQLLPLLR